MLEIAILGPHDAGRLASVADGVFDDPLIERATNEFLADPRHHLVVAIDDATVVGFVSAVRYVHPDKPSPELWINEVSVAPTHRGRGIASAMLRALVEVARDLGCSEAWVLTDRDNAPAMRLYASVGGLEAPSDQVMFTFPLDADRGSTREVPKV